MRPQRLRITGPDSPASTIEASAAPPSRGATRVIVKVRTEGYIPPGFDVRSYIDSTMFTATASPDAIERAATDPHVVSVAPARRLRPS
jgi:hypothetical protein